MQSQIWHMLWYFFAAIVVGLGENVDSKVTYLEPGTTIDYKPETQHRSFFHSDLRIYCYRGYSKTVGRLFETIELQLEIGNDDYTQYEGETPDEVREHYDQKRSLFSFSLFSQKRTRLQLSPFEQQCIGVETVQAYRVRLQQQRIDFWRVIQLIAGVVFFVYAGNLSHNSLFYYITGVIFGICASIMLITWLTCKLIPRRSVMYGALLGGWTLGFYVIQRLWENMQLIMVTYRTYVFWYVFITGVVSFFICYRFGPPKNQRSKNIIQWLLQIMSIALIYYASHFEEAMVAIIIITIIMYYFPRWLIMKVHAVIRRRFPPKRRLLTNEEYYEQGVKETNKALEELRTFASSPNCKQWKIITKLKDPLRFAEFVEGSSHLSDDEILNFESSTFSEDNSDSDSNLDEDGANVAHSQNNVDHLAPRIQLRNRQNLHMLSPNGPQMIEDDFIEMPSSSNIGRSTGIRYASTNVPTPGGIFARNSPLRGQDTAARKVGSAGRTIYPYYNNILHENNSQCD